MTTLTKPTFVIDSSALVAHLLHEPQNNAKITSSINAFYLNHANFIAPTLLAFEIGNVLKSCAKAKRLSTSEVKKLFAHFLKLPIKYVAIDFNKVLQSSLLHNLSYYDAAYYVLHQSTDHPLLTLDKKLLDLIK